MRYDGRMNYLAHHTMARRVFPQNAQKGEMSPLFFVGNLLPDLATLGKARRRLRTHHVADKVGDLAFGARFHFAADRQFHANAAFVECVAQATAQLKAATFAQPPRRLFFVAHIVVELALDGVLVQNEPETVADLYEMLARVSPEAVVQEAERTFDEPTPELGDALRWFTEARPIENYKTAEGLAETMFRIGRRAGVENFADVGDRRALASVFAELLPFVEKQRHDLLQPPPPLWYNSPNNHAKPVEPSFRFQEEPC